MTDLIEYRATFGTGHSGPRHPRWPGADHNGWLRVDAVDELIAREVLRDALDGAYSCIYAPGHDGYPQSGDPGGGLPDYYPHGQTGHLHAFRGPGNTGVAWRWIRTSHGGALYGELAADALEALAAEMPQSHRDGSLTPLLTSRYASDTMRSGAYAGWQIERAGYMDNDRHLGIVYLDRTGAFHCHGRHWTPGNDRDDTIGGGATALDALTVYAPPPPAEPTPTPSSVADHPLPWRVSQSAEWVPTIVDANGEEIDLTDPDIAAAIVDVINAQGARV